MPSTPQSLAIVLTCIVVGVAAAETPPPNAESPAAATPVARAEQSLLPSADDAWLLVLDSWGGYAGHGMGGVTIASDGKVFAHRLGHRADNDCFTRLTEAELQALTRAISAAEPSSWSASYDPAEDKACCDRFTWSLRLHHREADGAERVTHTGWHEASEGLPHDLLAVATIARRAMTSVLPTCNSVAYSSVAEKVVLAGDDGHLSPTLFEFVKPGVTRAEVDKRLGDPYVSSVSVVVADRIDLFLDEAPTEESNPQRVPQPTEDVRYYDYRPDKFPSEYARIVFRKDKVWYAMLPPKSIDTSVEKAQTRYGKPFVTSKIHKADGHILSVVVVHRIPELGVGLVEIPGAGITHRLVFPPEKR